MDAYISIRTYDVAQFAELDVTKLADEGIDSRVQDENMAALIPFLAPVLGGVKLLVKQDDADRAIEILDELETGSVYEEEIPAAERTDLCPKCGSPEYKTKGSIITIFASLILGIAPFAISVRRRHCTKCHHSWT